MVGVIRKQALSRAMKPARADERGRVRERGRADEMTRRDGKPRERRDRDGDKDDDRGRGERGERRPVGERGRPKHSSRRRRRPKTVWERTFGQYHLGTSHVAVLLSTMAVLLVFLMWTLPSYLAYRARPKFTQQFCVVRAASNATGCVNVNFLYISDSICDQTNEVVYDCSNLCVYEDAQSKARINAPGTDGLEATTDASRSAFTKLYRKGTEVPCWYPEGGGGFPDSLTFTKPNNPNAAMFAAVIWLLPFLLLLTVSVICMLSRPKQIEELEDSEMLTGLFEEVVTGREKQKRFVEEQEKKFQKVVQRVDGEAERRLVVVQEVEREKKERRENEDNLKHALNENIRSLESRLVSEMAHRLSKIPIPEKLKKKLLKKEGKHPGDAYDSKEAVKNGLRPDSAASIYDNHQRDERRRRGALDEDIEAQRNAFQKRMGERRGRDGERERGHRERSRGRSKSKTRRDKP